MDPNRSLKSRVQALMDAPKIHPKEMDNVDSNLCSLVIMCCKMRSLEGMQLVTEIMERILVEKERCRQAELVNVVIPVKLWEKVLYGWVNLTRRHTFAVERMLAVMETVIQQAEEDELQRNQANLDAEGLPSFPDVSIYNTLLKGLAQAGPLSPGSAALAQKTLQDMKDLHEKKGWHVKPNTRSYTLAIEAQANSKDRFSGERAAAIFEQVKQEHKEQVKAYQERKGVEYQKHMTKTMLHGKIVEADATMYTVAMKAALHSTNSAKHVLSLLDDAIADGVADLIHFEIAIRALTFIIETTKNPRDRFRQADTAEKLLYQSMSYEEKPRQATRTSLMNACLEVWSRAFVQEMGERTENLLRNMMERDVSPDVVSFHCAIRSWVKSVRFHGVAAVNRAEAILELQRKLADESDGDLPDYQTYSMVIMAHAGQGADSVRRAAVLLEEMIVAAHEGKLTKRPRDNPCAAFAAILSVVAQAPRHNDKIEAKETSEDKLWGDVNDDVTKLPEDPLDWALQVYDGVTQNTFRIEGLVADHHFYAAFLRALVVHGNPKTVDFEDHALRVWDRACMEGQVSRIVLDQVYKIPVLKAKLPPGDKKNIPAFWRRHVPFRWQ
jgi:hypothetical protein